MSAILRVQIFGVPGVFCATSNEKMDIARSALKLLLYLVTQGEKRVLRDKICSDLWPDCEPAKANSRLSSALWRLRRSLGEFDQSAAVLSFKDGSLKLIMDDCVTVDSVHFEKRALAFLADDNQTCWDGFSSEAAKRIKPFQGWYTPWALVEKVRLENLWERCLLAQLDRMHADGKYSGAIETAEALLYCDPLLEDVYEKLVEIYLHQGLPCMAKRQFERCRKVLQQELGVEPNVRLSSRFSTSLDMPMVPEKMGSRDDVKTIYALLKKSQKDLERVSRWLGVQT
jgi:DNA-binding SARP family transcriptional activator